jgi:hypothetical protein
VVFGLRTFFAPNDHQSDSTDEREPSEDWGNGDPILRLRRDMHGPKIHDMFPTGVGEALVGKRQRSENYQDNSGYRDWFHSFQLPSRGYFKALSDTKAASTTAGTKKMSMNAAREWEEANPKRHGTDRNTKMPRTCRPCYANSEVRV